MSRFHYFDIGLICFFIFATPAAAERMQELPTTVLPIVKMAQQDLVGRLGVDRKIIELVSVEDVIWPDTCLGLPAPELCARTVTPGFKIIFNVAEQKYQYHTDRHGGMFRFVESALPSQ